MLLGLVLAASLGAEAGVLLAQGGPPPTPAVGAWATYRWTAAVRERVPVIVQQRDAEGRVQWSVAEETVTPPPVYVTYAVVRADRRTYTLQIVTASEPGAEPPLSVTQVTVDRATGKALRSVIRRPKGLIATPEAELRPLRELAVQGVREEVTVPAGRFPAVRGRAAGGEVWVSDRVPPLGLVRAVWPEGTLELVASAPAGATDLLAGPR